MLTLPLRFVWRERYTIGIGRIVVSVSNLTPEVDMGYNGVERGHVVEDR
jgi:hypothetical protein